MVINTGGGGFFQLKRGGIQNADGYKIESIDLKSETGYVLVNVSDRNLSTKWISIFDEDVKNKPIPQRNNSHKWQSKGR